MHLSDEPKITKRQITNKKNTLLYYNYNNTTVPLKWTNRSLKSLK